MAFRESRLVGGPWSQRPARAPFSFRTSPSSRGIAPDPMHQFASQDAAELGAAGRCGPARSRLHCKRRAAPTQAGNTAPRHAAAGSRRANARAGRACVGTACAVVPSAPCLPLRARVRASALASRSACGCVGRAGPALAGPAWPAHREGWEKRKREAREERGERKGRRGTGRKGEEAVD